MTNIKHTIVNIFSSSPYQGLPVNSQLTSKMLLDLGCQVNYFEPIGLRKISLIRDFKKIKNRLLKTKNDVQLATNLNLIKTIALPPRWKLDWLQRKILQPQLKASQKAQVNFIFLPSFAPIIEDLSEPIIYFVVDKYDRNPGTEAKQIEKWEDKILSKVKIVLTSSPSLFKHYQQKHSTVYLWPNVCNKIAINENNKSTIYFEIEKISEPRIITWGNITGYKMNLPLLQKTAIERPELNFILIGDQGIGEIDSSIPEMPSNVYFFSRTSQEELQIIGRDLANVLALWNLNTGSGEFSLPMKLGEYMYCEKPIILQDSPAIPKIEQLNYFDSDPHQSLNNALSQSRISYDMDEYTYEARLEKLIALMSNL